MRLSVMYRHTTRKGSVFLYAPTMPKGVCLYRIDTLRLNESAVMYRHSMLKDACAVETPYPDAWIPSMDPMDGHTGTVGCPFRDEGLG